MQKRALILSFILVGLLFVSLVSASYQLNSSSISSSYGPSGIISGNINISFNSEPYNTIIRGVIGSDSYQITLKEFLSKNSLSPVTHYSCSTSKCELAYSAMGAASSSKSFSLNSSVSKAIGFNLSDSFSSIEANGFNLTVSSNYAGGCTLPLKIDILDDGSYEWIPYQSTSDFCDSSTGCYTLSASSDNRTFGAGITYCNRMGLSSFPSLNVGASILEGTSSSLFTMTLIGENISSNNVCSFTANGAGSYSCDINASSRSPGYFDICISSSASDYKMNMARSLSGCGYINDPTAGNVSFPIFAKPYKYAPLGTFSLNSPYLSSLNLGENTNMESYVSNYLQEVYGEDCSKGCVIPIRFSSLENQDIALSSPKVVYRLISGANTVNSLYDLDNQPSTLTVGYKNLDISKLGAKAPSGNVSNPIFQLYVGNTKILSKNISMLDVPSIEYVSIQKAPAGISTYFEVKTKGKNITQYKWNFGDNTSISVTDSSSIYHTYAEVGTYNLAVEAINDFGNSSKIFSIQVTSSGEYIPSIIDYTNTRITSLKTLIASFPQFVNDYFKNKFRLEALSAQISSLKAEYDNAGGSASKYSSIAQGLSNISVPDLIKSIELQSIKFLVNKDIINIADVEETSGEKKGTGTDEQYKEQIYAWNFNSLDINLDEEVYAAFYGGLIDSPVTRIKVKVAPKETVEDAYLIINAKKSDIIFKDSSLASQAKDLGASTSLALGSLSAPKEIEFLLSTRFNILDSPIYFATKFSLLPKQYVPGGCNYNQICEKDAGETSSNCRNDCTPTGMTLLWLVLLLVGFLVAYIILQEWYKRNYEAYLFANKNDLFNLIHFIDNAEKQKLTKSDMFNKLGEKSWNHEQIEYAYKKYKGQRTGMWEIPVLKFMENRQVNEELLKRKNLGVNPGITPRPIMKFNPVGNRPVIVPRPPVQNTLSLSNNKPLVNPTVPAKPNALVKPNVAVKPGIPPKPNNAIDQKKP